MTTPFRNAIASLLDLDSSSLLSAEEEKKAYAAAFTLYEGQEYKKAGALFTRLVMTNPFFPFYWKGLAASKQMQRDYEAALHAWALFSLLDTGTEGHLHAAECFIQIGDKEEAKKALQCACDTLTSPEFEERVHLLQRSLDALD